MAEGNGTDLGIGLGAKLRAVAAEKFCPGKQLGVYLQSYDYFVCIVAPHPANLLVYGHLPKNIEAGPGACLYVHILLDGSDRLARSAGLNYYRSAVRSLLGTFTSTSCVLPSRMIVTFTLILPFVAWAASVNAVTELMSFPSNRVMISPSLRPAFAAVDSSSTSNTFTPLPSSPSWARMPNFRELS